MGRVVNHEHPDGHAGKLHRAAGVSGLPAYESNVRRRSSTETSSGDGARGGSAGAVLCSDAGGATGGTATGGAVVVVVEGAAVRFGVTGFGAVVVVGFGAGGLVV